MADFIIMFSSTFSASAGADIADFNFLIFAITYIDPSISFCCYYKQKKNPPTLLLAFACSVLSF